MKKLLMPAILVILVSLLSGGCSKNNGELVAVLDHGFTLTIGQKAVVDKTDLKIRFDKILEDSRCPAGVQCIWEGRVSVSVELEDSQGRYKMVLIQPGSSDNYVTETYKNYLITYKITPYPQQNEEIDDSGYRLLLIISQRD